MHFKRLELLGFKSFADQTVIHFEPGVTAIVGPNGCGKSNIADSIRWVLGEQSAKSLRGSSMEDVIFNGSAVKEQLNLAEVSLTLSNEKREFNIDYDEVTITRRLYRSGDSEYLINKNTVRLKDIHEMLMGTGVGTDSYSIIEQGKMDMILNSKPEDRRVIFEEAAGITKFKAKKKEALRKLEQTDANLLRVNDIIQEVKRQIGSVERQARRAETYKELFDELKNAELRQATRQFVIFEKDRREREQNLNELKARELEYAAVAKEVEATFEAKRHELIEIESAVSRYQTQELETSGEIRMRQDRVLLNHERMGEIEARRKQIETEVEAARTRIAELDSGFARLDEEFRLAAAQEAEGQSFLASVEASFTEIESLIRAAQEADAGAQAALFDLAKERAGLQSELAKIGANRSTLDARYKKLKDREASLRAQAASVSEELDEQIRQCQAQEARVAQALAEKNEREARLSNAGESLKAGERALSELLAQSAALNSKLTFLKDLKDRYEGFLGGVQALVRDKESGAPHVSGMLGLLAERISVHKGQELAVEAALSPFSQAVLFSDSRGLLDAVEHLRHSKKGRALLLSLEGASRNGHLSARPDEGASILDSIQADPQTLGVLQSLCSNIFVVEDAGRAHELARRNPNFIFVTRTGERFEGELVTAGESSGQTEHLIVGRQARLDELERESDSLRRMLADSQAAVESMKASDAGLRSELGSLSEELPRLQMQMADTKAGLRHIEDKKRRMDEEAEVYALEIAELRSEEERWLAKESEWRAALEALAVKESEIQSGREAQLAISREKTLERESLLVRLAETRSRQSQRVADREKAEKERQWLLESKAAEEARLTQLDAQSQEGDQRRLTLESENELLKSEIEQGLKAKESLFLEMDGSRRARESVLSALSELENERASKTEFLNDARNKAHQFELQTTEIRYEIDRLKDRIFNAYQIDLTTQADIQQSNAEAQAALAGDGADTPAQDESERIAQLREKLNKMGPVNLVAIQEHDEMKERFEFLTQQQADLVQAKDDLHKAILKMNRTTKELFTTTFEQIQKNFTEYFKLLFGGGTAELVLMDENDVLESGIEIVARPPGKKLQNITLLSGGEKALTAVALLFSIFRVKPSPFCVLDEIDAPLDESNVDRFCNVLREFITGSQFILVTHNKRTMSLADAMYGITMAQTGISRVVSVKFSENQDRKRRASDKKEVIV